jgi:hypothetical protein
VRTARRVDELGGGEHPSNRQGRRQQLLDGAHALGYEETLALAGPPPPEVAG